MAEETKVNKADDNKKDDKHANIDVAAASKFSKMAWIVLVAVVLSSSGGGIGLAKIFAGQEETELTQPLEEENELGIEEQIPNIEEVDQFWEYNMDSVIANLDEPGVTRYIRTALILRFNADLDEATYKPVLEAKKSDLIDWLYTYMTGLSLEEVQGSRSIERFKSEVAKRFNEILFPDSKPMLIKVLTKEFQIQ